jgi:hypothetical protein
MSLSGFPEHTRNVSLFNVGIYCKKAYPDRWKLMVRSFNEKLFTIKKLSERDVETIIKSLDKKEYSYQCGEEPLCSFCNAKLCRTRRWGISNVAGMPIVNSVTKVTGDIAMWFIDVEGGRLEMTTDELYDNRRFVMRCLNDLNILPIRMKPEQWTTWIQNIADKAIEIKDDRMFQRHEIPEQFKNFMIARLSKNQGDIATNRTWYDRDNQEIRFKWEAFIDYLKYRKITPNKATIVMYFKSRNSKYGVGKDKLRRSFRYMSLKCTDEEIMAMIEKENMEEIL